MINNIKIKTMIKPLTKTNIPDRFYWDGLKLWGIYIGIRYNRRYKEKDSERYYKGSVEDKNIEDMYDFNMYHLTISKETAEKLYPEYFI